MSVGVGVKTPLCPVVPGEESEWPRDYDEERAAAAAATRSAGGAAHRGVVKAWSGAAHRVREHLGQQRELFRHVAQLAKWPGLRLGLPGQPSCPPEP
jgi:hypothetical protein